MAYTLIQPIVDNREAFKQLFPGAYYAGDIGDTSHLADTGDHTPWASDVIFGLSHQRGFVYAQDFGQGGSFDLPRFARWILDEVRAGRRPEIKYIITLHPANAGQAKYYGLFDRRYGWTHQDSSGHDHHIHISYMPGAENSRSTLIADFYQSLYPTTQEDDMPQVTSIPLPAGFGSDEKGGIISRENLVTVSFDPTEIGTAGFGEGLLVIGSDAQQAAFRLATYVHDQNYWTFAFKEGNSNNSKKVAGIWGQWEHTGNPLYLHLPKGCSKLSIAKAKLHSGDTQSCQQNIIATLILKNRS